MNQKNNEQLIRWLIIISFILFALFLTLSFFVTSSGPISQQVTTVDHNIQSYVLTHPLTESQAKFFVYVTLLANPLPLVLFSTIIFLILVIVHHRRLAGLFIFILVVSGGVSQFYKVLIARSRPTDILYSIDHYGFAYPSAHALAGILFYGFLGFCLLHAIPHKFFRFLLSCITIATVFLIGLSRIVLGVHWFSDVIGGYLVGGALLGIIIAIYYLVVRIVTKTPVTT